MFPKLFDLGEITLFGKTFHPILHTYGVLLAAGFLIAITLVATKTKKLGVLMYEKAKVDKAHRFWGLVARFGNMETLHKAYRLAKKKGGASGVDGVTFEAIEAEEEGVEAFLEQWVRSFSCSSSIGITIGTIRLAFCTRAGSSTVVWWPRSSLLFGCFTDGTSPHGGWEISWLQP